MPWHTFSLTVVCTQTVSSLVNVHVSNAKKLILQLHYLYNILDVHVVTWPNAYSFFNLIVLGEDYLVS